MDNVEQLTKKCLFKGTCKRYNGACAVNCYPFVFLHGTTGEGGFTGVMNVPKRYKGILLKDLEVSEGNEQSFNTFRKYVADLNKYVREKNVGLFIYSEPTPTNPLGTGTGKTTIATAILNEYLVFRVREKLKGQADINGIPCFFLSASEYQNAYNSQFRGTSKEIQQENADRFYSLKDLVKRVELLVIDDIAVRDMTEGFKNELFEVIDYRTTNDLTLIFTSNYSLTEVSSIVGERIASRIDGACGLVKVTGEDRRKGGLFK